MKRRQRPMLASTTVYSGSASRWRAVMKMAQTSRRMQEEMSRIIEHQELVLKPISTHRALENLGFIFIDGPDFFTGLCVVRSSMFGEEPLALWETIGCPAPNKFPKLTSLQLDILVEAIRCNVKASKLADHLAACWPRHPKSRKAVLDHLGIAGT